MTHLTRAELERWRDTPAAADRASVIAHLAECDACGAELAELMRTRPRSETPALETAPFLAAGLGRGPAPVAAPRWRRLGIPLAAAAAIILAVTTLVTRGPGARRGGDEKIRLESPSGTVAASDLTFTWTAPAAAASQRLLIYALDDPGRPVVDARNVVPPLRLTPEQAARLTRDADYRWLVEFTNAGGAVETSPATPFRLR
jgi:hypothetical protein